VPAMGAWKIGHSRPSRSSNAVMPKTSIGLRRGPEIGLVGLVTGEQFGGIVIVDGRGDDHVAALFPVGRRRHLVLGGELQRIDHPQHLVEIAPGGHRIDQDQLDLLIRANDKNVAHGLVVSRCAIGRVAR